MGKFFGTDGVRGIANQELTTEFAFKLGQAGAFVLTKETNHKPKILIGKDTRISSDMLEAALAAGICSVGAEVVLLGYIPTPAVAYLTRLYGADAGVVISASHNSFEYNGIKFFNEKGYKLPDATEDKIEDIIIGSIGDLPRTIGGDVGRITRAKTSLDDYVKYAVSTVDVKLNGLKVAVDCANGAASKTAKAALDMLGAEVYIINNSPNGININAKCGSTHLEYISEYTTMVKADIGVAFDGDADRVLMIDEKGELIDGDKIMAILANDMKKSGKLEKDTVVATIMSNLGLFLYGEKNGINIEKTKVGDRYVLENMLKNGYSIGGEQSGHVILLDYNSTGDGLITALQMLQVVAKNKKKVSELAKIMKTMPQALINAKVKTENKMDYLEDIEITKLIQEIEVEFSGEGRVVIRPSGTEPLVRVMIEGNDHKRIEERARQLADLIEKKLS